jgi:hypothetical protein
MSRHGSEDPDPDPPQNVMDPQHWFQKIIVVSQVKVSRQRRLFEAKKFVDYGYIFK